VSVTRAVRKARKPHRCDGCNGRIQAGEPYLTHTALAGDDYYHDALQCDTYKPLNQPIRFKECAPCATRYDRGHLLTPEEANGNA
jgi:hypothetical protein